MSFLEECWEEREVKQYKEIFETIGDGIYPISREIFGKLNTDAIDPRWLTHGVFVSPPSEKRNTWAYVTSGMSNPWESEAPEEYSGLGMEFVLETNQESNWAIEVLQTLMAYNLLIAAGKKGEATLLDYGDRVPLGLSESITTMMFTHPINFPESFTIKSGDVDLIQVIGITADELTLAKDTSSNAVRNKIINETGGLITSIVSNS
ncbi:MAG: suppressor of fused domain protein [Marinicellaceae bacterium]